MSEKLLTIEEVAQYLGLSEEAVKGLVEKGEMPAYKVGGSFLRFKKEQIETYRQRIDSSLMAEKALFRDRGVRDSLPGEGAERRAWIGRGNVSRSADIAPYAFWEKLENFLYYNDFYILSLILLVLIVLAVLEF